MSVVDIANGFQIQSSLVGVITTVAGNGNHDYSGDGAQATLATLNIPEGVAVGALGIIYIADTYNHRIRMVNESTGVIATVAGNGTAGYSGDGRQATLAKLKYPAGVAVDVSGNIYIADTSNYCIRRRTESTGIISTVAGTGTSGYSGDGGQATLARLSNPQGIAVDVLGNIYVADQFNNRIRIITNGVITTVAGTGGAGAFNGNGGKATSAVIVSPDDVAVDASGNIYIVERERHRVRMVTKSTGLITTVAGDGTASFNGNGGLATSAGLSNPYGVAVDISGNLYITQGTLDDHRVRMVTKSSGIITTVAGTGTSGFSGDGAQATAAKLNGPQSVAVDALGNVFVADTYNNRIRTFATNALPTSSPSTAPTSTSSPSTAPTSTSSPSAAPTSTPSPSTAPTSTPSPSAAPTSTPSPTAAPTSTPSPSTVPATSLAATTPTTSSTALSGNALIGVISGVGCFLLILLILAVICFCRRRASQKLKRAAAQNVVEESAPSTADPEMVQVAVVMPMKENILNYVVLQKFKSEGKCSSSNSWIVEGLLTNVITNIKSEVMVKLVEKDRIGKAEKEFRIMNILYNDSTSNHDYFIAPLSPSLLYGSKGQIKGHGGEDCSAYVGIAMEKGIRNMKEILQGGSNLTINGVKLDAEKLLNIIIAADQAKVVLMDFKLSNIVRVSDHHGLHLKAIDFECSCNVNDPISTDTTAFYSCPEVARWVIKGCLPSETPLASHKMDVMAYGFCLYEMASKVVYNDRSRSYWENGGVTSGQVDAHSVNAALASLTDEQVKANLERTFVGTNFGNLRSFLQQALRVDPEARSSGVRLLNQSSFLGSTERTLDHKGLGAQLSRIEMKVDGLSERLSRGFDTVGTTLDTITANVVSRLINGDPEGIKTSKGVAALSEALKAQKGKSGIDDDALSSRITGIIEEQMSGMGVVLCQDLKKSLGNVLAKSDVSDGCVEPSRDDKLDALLVMVTSMQEKMDGFTDDFKRFNAISLEHYSASSKGRNLMPSSFLLLPDVTVAVDASASVVNKMFNRARRLKDRVVKLGWNKVRVVFFCPVTLKIVKCGPYVLASPTKELRYVAFALKWGHLLAKLVLATQGLGLMVPDIKDLLPDVDSTILSGVLEIIVEDLGDETRGLGAGLAELSSSDLVDKVYRRIVESHGKQHGWQPADRWGMKLVGTPCGSSVWVTEGEAEEAVETKGMDAVNAARWSCKVATPSK